MLNFTRKKGEKTMNKKVLAILSIILVFALLFAFAGCSLTEEDETETTVIDVKTPLPTDITSSYDEESHIVTDTEYSPEALAANTVTIFEYFNLHMNEIKSSKASVSMSQNKRIGKATDENGDSIPMSDNNYVNAAITSLDSYMLHNDGASLEYGEDLTAFMPVKGESYVSALTLDEVESATCVDEGERRIITVTLKSPALPATIEKAYDMENVDEVMAEFEKANEYMTIEKPVITYKNCKIIITADVTTDEVIAIEYIKSMDVNTTVTGQGKLADIGVVPVVFNYSNTIRYNIDRTDPATSTTLAEK